MADEYDCSACGRHMIRLTGMPLSTPPRCLSCQELPGWYRDPALRRAIDPDHDGRDQPAPEPRS